MFYFIQLLILESIIVYTSTQIVVNSRELIAPGLNWTITTPIGLASRLTLVVDWLGNDHTDASALQTRPFTCLHILHDQYSAPEQHYSDKPAIAH